MFSENESFITGFWPGGTSYNNNPGGGVLRFSHYDIENFSQYYVDRVDSWQDPENLPNPGYWDLGYLDGGQLIQNDFVSADIYNLVWVGANIPSGVYIVRAENGVNISTQKVMLLK